MLRTLAHRGPDDEFTLSDEHATIGARRLAIIDLDTGRQPLTNEDATVWVSQNGEIYNFVELRDALQKRGHRLTTHGDTEVIAHLYEDYDLDFVNYLRGMFAIAIWDQKQRRVVLVRDRVGKKPLYWRLQGTDLVYGSELKALLSCTTDARLDQTALAMFLQYQYVPSPLTAVEGMNKLEPASMLVWQDGKVDVRRYWDVSYLPKSAATPAEQSDECLEILREATRLRMRSDVPVGVFLSGGVDSSLVAALVAEASPGAIRTFTLGFASARFDERPYARTTARLLASEHAEDFVTVDAARELPALVRHFDEPFGDASALATFLVARLARDLKVVLTGDGGDEAFAGYDRYRLHQFLASFDFLPDRLRRMAVRSIRLALKRTGRPGHEIPWDDIAELTGDARYVRLVSVFGRTTRSELAPDGPATDWYLAQQLDRAPANGIDRVLYADLHTYLPEDMLVKVDRATMAMSLEARSPLLDQRFVEFAANLPGERKLRRAASKVLLREVASRLLPTEVLRRPKMGFQVPVAQWFRGELRSLFVEAALAPDAASRDVIDTRVSERLLNEHMTGSANHGHRLWLLLILELWCRTWLRPSQGTLA
jgi:asparagine synthase (glutamine-hydrolysing)